MLRILRSIGLGLGLCITPLAFADEPENATRADTNALHTLFGEDVLASNVQQTQVEAAGRSPQERFEYLKNSVLPPERPHAFRVIGRFLTTHPADEIQTYPHRARKSLWKPASADEPIRNDHGGVIVSPVLDLIETARELDRLTELENAIKSRSAETADEHRDRLALLFLTALAGNDIPAVTAAFDAFIPYAAMVPDERGADRWPEVLILQQGLANSETRLMVGEWAMNEFVKLFEYSPQFGLDVMNDHFRSLTGHYGGLRHNKTASPLPNWTVDSYLDSSTRGHGRPTACWQQRGHELHKISGHESDYLTYRIPLRGNYQIECDYTTGSRSHGGFVVAGRRLEMYFHNSRLKHGNYRKDYEVTKITPKMASGRWGRFRAVIDDRHLQAFFNGRLVHEEILPVEHNPWFTFRSWRRSHPVMKDLRITGTPTIPDQILLTAEAEMPGWVPYYERGFGANQGFWSAKTDETGTVVVQGYPRFDVRGEGMEKWLRYHRPMIEDGTIEYEFFYQKDLVGVYPALGRLAFLLKPDGVHTHWITDGRHETTGLDPFNADFNPEFQRGPNELPLHEDAWNRLQLSIEGRTVRLTLNGEFIFERPLEATNQRVFGLFHYADLTEALVKNVVWRGDWPKTLPEQELADPVLVELDRSAEELPDVWRHDFKNGIPADWFDSNGDSTAIKQTETGIATSRTGSDGFKELLACVEFAGDFDVSIRFEDFSSIQPAGEKSFRSGLALKVITDTASETSATVYRRLDWDGHKVACARIERKADGRLHYQTDRADEFCSSGQLRLARRGDQLYSLYAEGDSPNFRIIDQVEFPTAPVRVRGLKFLLQADKPQVKTDATWNELTIRADRIYGGPIENQRAIADRLNQQRNDATVRVIDFTSLAQASNQVTIPGLSVMTTTTADGDRWQVEATGFRPGDLPYKTIALPRGTVDVDLALDIHDIETGPQPENRTEVGLELYLPVANFSPDDVGPFDEIQGHPYKITWMFRTKGNGRVWLISRAVSRNLVGKPVYLPIRSVPVESPDHLRFVIDRGTLYFLYSEADSEDWHVQAALKIRRDDFSSGTAAAYAYANTSKWATDVTWKTLTIATNDNEPTLEVRDEP
ncbi:DUF1583 domain-containing protein [Thalassoroseus pseudoceratinae]|uniref:DUF1583 domain-containing protein n=1 Tax=Thalassoroseus pseudoceratinae TaxID=2713176 RepID=UPI0014242D59|nr:DUF1583 domain-containing protein [Thalassoroseus pseudoceratinae]